MDDQPPGGRLVELDEGECRQLLGSVPVGRLAWQGAEGLTVIPVNFSFSGDEIVVHTAAYTALARECDDAPVAFQVDQVDTADRSGWSVLARGTAHVRLPSAGEDHEGGRPWAGGARPFEVAVAVASVTGRRLMPS